MPNDHYISKFLTKRWEVQPDRMLHYFDFGTCTFGAEPYTDMFAREGLHTPETGEILNRLVEQPVAQHLRPLESNPLALLPMPDTWERFRAFASLWWLQPQRLADVRTPGELAMNLDQLLARGEDAVNVIGRLAQQHFEFFLVRTRERLFFTEAVSFPLPFAGAVSLALPLSPHHFCTFVQNEVHNPEGQIQGILNTPLMLSALSIGVGTNVQKVVLPPEMIPKGTEDESRARAGLSMIREASRRLVNVIGEASAIAGLPTFRVT